MITLINSGDYLIALKEAIQIYDNKYIQLNLSDEDSVIAFFSNNSLFEKKNNIIMTEVELLHQLVMNEKFLTIIHYINIFSGNIILINTNEKITFKNFSKIKINDIISIPKIGTWNINMIIEKELTKHDLNFGKKEIEYLSIILDFNYGIIENEIKKLSLLNKQTISINDIKKVCSFSNNDSIFKIVDYYLNFKNDKAFELMEFFFKNNMSIDQLFAMMVTQLFKVKIYCIHYQNHHSIPKILTDFKLKAFQINHLERFIKKEPLTRIDKIMNDLYDIDFKTKKQYNNKHQLLTLFLLKEYY